MGGISSSYMQKKTKGGTSIMKKKIALLLCAVLLLCAPFALADGAQITAQGSAEISAKPDMFTIVSNVSITESTVAKAQDAVSAVIADAAKKLVAIGVLEDDIVTENFSYYPEYDYSSSYEEPRLIGYRVNHSLRVTCRDLGMLDSVMAVLTDCGMTETWNVSFDISTRGELYRQALTLAIGAANEKADTMAQAAGLVLSRVKSVEEHQSGDVARYANAAEDAVMMKATAAGMGIRSGDVSVSASVTVVYDAQ